jgi:uncharacterized protein YoxC
MSTLETISQVGSYLLAPLGVIALIALIVALVRLAKVLKDAQVTVGKVNTTVDGANEAVGTVNGYLKDLKTTVNTVNNTASSVEAVRATAESAVKKSLRSMTREYNAVKKAVAGMLPGGRKKGAPVPAVPQQTEPSAQPAGEKAEA